MKSNPISWRERFYEKLENPKNTGYRVGQEYTQAVENFIESELKNLAQVVRETDVSKRKGLWLKNEHEKEDCVNMGYKLACEDIAKLIENY